MPGPWRSGSAGNGSQRENPWHAWLGSSAFNERRVYFPAVPVRTSVVESCAFMAGYLWRCASQSITTGLWRHFARCSNFGNWSPVWFRLRRVRAQRLEPPRQAPSPRSLALRCRAFAFRRSVVSANGLTREECRRRVWSAVGLGPAWLAAAARQSPPRAPSVPCTGSAPLRPLVLQSRSHSAAHLPPCARNSEP
jgi:hypothetical protein